MISKGEQVYTGSIGMIITVPEGLYFPNQHPDHTDTPESIWAEVSRCIREALENIGVEVNGVFNYEIPYKHTYIPQLLSNKPTNEETAE